MSNKGIIVSGGSFNAGQLAVGDNATIHNYGRQEQQAIVERLDLLVLEVRAAGLAEPERRRLVGVVDTLKEEAVKAKPDKSAIQKGLALIEMAAPSVSGIAAAVTLVKEVVALALLP